MTMHPCKGLSRAAHVAFDQIAVNGHPQCTWPTIDELILAGVILRGPDETRRDAMGIYRVPSFCVPVGIHHQWCRWCSEQLKDGSPREEDDHEAACDQAKEGGEEDQDRTTGRCQAGGQA